jgi:exodeoxyribonuclease-5
MTTTECSIPTTTQSQQIKTALVAAIDLGLIEWEYLEDGPLAPQDEFAALNLLAEHRSLLKKSGMVFPAKSKYQDRLQINPIDAESWQVLNLSKGTEYTVSVMGLRLDCTCSQWGGGWCKHRDAVEAWRDETGSIGPFGVPDDEPEIEPEYQCDTPPAEPVANEIYWEGVTSDSPKYHPFEFPATFTPSPEQSIALNALADWYYSTEPIFRLTGYAGTGKSTATQSFIKWLRALTLPPKIAVAASINKAVKVQRRILGQWGLGDIPTHTCAQLFGVKRRIEDNGDEVFTPDPDAYAFYQDYDIIIVDEAGTINQQGWELLLDATHSSLLRQTRFVVMGDPAQLPPVNEGESMAFRHPCPSAHLSTVQRYDGAIAVLADEVRRNLGRESMPVFTTEIDPDTRKGIYSVERPVWEAMVSKVFTGDEYQANPEHAKILAYTNKRVGELNFMVRSALGYRAPWVVGERIIALAPYSPAGQGMPIITTSDEATITGVYEGFVSGLEVWFLTLDNGETIPVPRYFAPFEAELKQLRKEGRHGRYWALKESVAWITYAYALTVHRSQGSTYAYAFVDVGNFKGCRGSHRTESGERVLERNQLLYVALTRPSERLIICL